jgi:hypothetical protein
MFGRRKSLAEDLAAEGSVTALPTVLHTKTRWTSGTNYENGPYTVGNNRHMTVELRVEPEDEEPFVAEFRQNFKGRIPVEGAQVKVIFDPADHADRGPRQQGPPAGDQPRADRTGGGPPRPGEEGDRGRAPRRVLPGKRRRADRPGHPRYAPRRIVTFVPFG